MTINTIFLCGWYLDWEIEYAQEMLQRLRRDEK